MSPGCFLKTVPRIRTDLYLSSNGSASPGLPTAPASTHVSSLLSGFHFSLVSRCHQTLAVGNLPLVFVGSRLTPPGSQLNRLFFGEVFPESSDSIMSPSHAVLATLYPPTPLGTFSELCVCTSCGALIHVCLLPLNGKLLRAGIVSDVAQCCCLQCLHRAWLKYMLSECIPADWWTKIISLLKQEGHFRNEYNALF